MDLNRSLEIKDRRRIYRPVQWLNEAGGSFSSFFLPDFSLTAGVISFPGGSSSDTQKEDKAVPHRLSIKKRGVGHVGLDSTTSNLCVLITLVWTFIHHLWQGHLPSCLSSPFPSWPKNNWENLWAGRPSHLERQ